MEFNKTRWSCSWSTNSKQNCTQNSVNVSFCLSKRGPCAVISSQISSKFTGEAVYHLLCMSPHAFFGVHVVNCLGFQAKWDGVNRDFLQFDGQIASNSAALFSFSHQQLTYFKTEALKYLTVPQGSITSARINRRQLLPVVLSYQKP